MKKLVVCMFVCFNVSEINHDYSEIKNKNAAVSNVTTILTI